LKSNVRFHCSLLLLADLESDVGDCARHIRCGKLGEFVVMDGHLGQVLEDNLDGMKLADSKFS
jgi:hypothetical protein